MPEPSPGPPSPNGEPADHRVAEHRATPDARCDAMRPAPAVDPLPSTHPRVITLAAGTNAVPATAPAGVTPETAYGSRTLVLCAADEHVILEAPARLTLRVGASSLTLEADGTIILHGTKVVIAADETLSSVSAGSHTIAGAVVDIN